MNITHNIIKFESGREISFDFNISPYHAILDNILVVILRIPNISNKELSSRNAFGIDILKEEIIWQISFDNKTPNGFDGAWISNDKSTIGLWGHQSYHVLIDKENGRIIEYLPGY